MARINVTPTPVTFDSVTVNAWSASGNASGHTGTDTFFVRNGKIEAQTFAFKATPRG